MFELFVVFLSGVITVVLFSIGIGMISQEQYNSIEARVKKEIPNYQKILPKYELVETIPIIENRKNGIKYVNDAETLTLVKYTDMNRLLHGETIDITNTPIEYKSTNNLKTELKSKAKELSSKYEIRGFEKKYAVKRADDKMRKLFCKEIQELKGTYIKTQKKIKTSNKDNFDAGVYAHEDTHAYFHRPRGSKASMEEQNIIIESENILTAYNEQNKNNTKKQKKLEQKITGKKNELEDSMQPVWDISKEQHITNQEQIEHGIKILENELDDLNNEKQKYINKKNEMIIKAKNIHDKTRSIHEVEEGITHSIGEFYNGTNETVSENYKKEKNLEPENIRVAKKNSSKFIQFIGPRATKDIAIDAMNEAYDNGNDAVELFNEKTTDYFGDENKKGMLGIFKEMTEDPKKYFKNK